MALLAFLGSDVDGSPTFSVGFAVFLLNYWDCPCSLLVQLEGSEAFTGSG